MRAREKCLLLSPGVPDRLLRIKTILKSLWQMRFAGQIRGAGGNDVLVCSLKGLFLIDEGVVNRDVAQ